MPSCRQFVACMLLAAVHCSRNAAGTAKIIMRSLEAVQEKDVLERNTLRRFRMRGTHQILLTADSIPHTCWLSAILVSELIKRGHGNHSVLGVSIL
jgi:hypothetical protein